MKCESQFSFAKAACYDNEETTMFFSFTHQE